MSALALTGPAGAGKSSLLAHDLDGIDRVDRVNQVIALSHEKVTERGSYAQLIKAHGGYLRI